MSDETFIAKLNKHCIEHVHFESRASKQFLSDMSLPHDCFRLKHYAGSVSVQDEWINRNVEILKTRAQLFEGRLALNSGLNLTMVSFSFVQKHFLG